MVPLSSGEDSDVLGDVVDSVDDVVLPIRNEEVAARVVGNAHGIVEFGGGC